MTSCIQALVLPSGVVRRHETAARDYGASACALQVAPEGRAAPVRWRGFPLLARLNAAPATFRLPPRPAARGLGVRRGLRRPANPKIGLPSSPSARSSFAFGESALHAPPSGTRSVAPLHPCARPLAKLAAFLGLAGRRIRVSGAPGLRPPPRHRRWGADGSARCACSPPCGLPGGSPRLRAVGLGADTPSEATARRSLTLPAPCPPSPLQAGRCAPVSIDGAAPLRACGAARFACSYGGLT